MQEKIRRPLLSHYPKASKTTGIGLLEEIATIVATKVHLFRTNSSSAKTYLLCTFFVLMSLPITKVLSHFTFYMYFRFKTTLTTMTKPTTMAIIMISFIVIATYKTLCNST